MEQKNVVYYLLLILSSGFSISLISSSDGLQAANVHRHAPHATITMHECNVR